MSIITEKDLKKDKKFIQNFKSKNTKPFELIGLNIQPYQPLKNSNADPVEPKSKSTSKSLEKETTTDLSEIPFSHLHCHSQYSVLQSTARIDALVAKAVEEKMPALALTDLGNMYGIFKFVRAANKVGIKPIVGCELNVARDHKDKSVKDNGAQMVFLCKNKNGYHNLAKLSSLAFINGFYYVPRIDKNLVKQYADDLIVLSGGIRGELADLILNVGETQAEETLLWWKEVFKDDFYIELVKHNLPENDRVNETLLKLANKHHVKVIAANNCFYITQKESDAHDVLLCVKEGELKSTPIGKGRGYRYGFPNDHFYFKSQEEMKSLFSDIPEAIINIQEIVDKCEAYKLEREVLLPKYDIPEEFIHEEDEKDGGKRGENAYLRYLTYEGAKKRYAEITDEIKERLDFELATIANTGYPGYFLIVQDFTAKAREMNVAVGPGRGSAAGSVVAYCIGITNVDPIQYDLLFERFLTPDRVSLPDIDIDFDDVGRAAVIEYVINKYGKNQVAQIITYGSMAAKSAIRDAGRVLALPLSDTDKLAKLIPEAPGMTLQKSFKESKELVDIKGQTTPEGEVLRQAEIIEGSVRNTGIHACGVIITPDDITKFIPVANSKDSDLLCTQFDNSVVEDAGMLKMDFLGLKTLTIIKDAIEIIEAHTGKKIDPDEIPLDDPKTFELYQKGETNGTFQFESAGMQKHLRDLKPNKFEDLIAMNALYRPGPLEYIPNFIARKHGREKIAYDLPEMEEYLANTYGITVYQEQVMLLSQKLAGFSKGDADVLRKAMGKKIFALLEKLKPQFLEGGAERGHDKGVLEKIWKDWEAFAAYAFNKSHSTCYSVVAFQTAYLKANYPAEYMASVLTNNMNDIKKVTFFMDECRRMGMKVLGPDVNESYHKFAVNEKGEIRFGLGAIKGVGEGAVATIINERKENGNYSSIFDVVKRIDLKAANKKTFESLILAGAFDSFEDLHRAQYFYENDKTGSAFFETILKFGNSYQDGQNSSQVSLFGGESEEDIPEPIVPPCEKWGTLQKLSKEKDVVGVYISGHPLDDFKIEMEHYCKYNINQLKDLDALKGKEVTFAGIVTEASHRTTKTGKPFGNFTIEDYTDAINMFLFSQDYVNFKNFLNIGWFLFVKGKVQARFRDSDQLEIKITHIELLQEIKDKLTDSITLKLNLDDISEKYIEKVNKLLVPGSGNSRVKLVVEDVVSDIRLTLPAKSLKINVTKELIDSLEEYRIPYKLN